MQISKIIDELVLRDAIHTLDCGRRGIEKEGLRYTSSDRLAQTPHPRSLGSPLTHPEITTDYAESMLELVTPAFRNRRDTLTHLRFLHRVLAADNEGYILNGSMPAYIADTEAVAIGRYGDSNQGKMRTLYRKGLALRYGKAMQLISGMHFNYSLCLDVFRNYAEILGQIFSQPFIDKSYMNLVRNIRIHAWLISYLFGHSPAVDSSFFNGRPHALDTLDESTLYLPYATSLRMSDIGYHNKTPVIVCANTLGQYIGDLQKAVFAPSVQYEALGLRDNDGHLQQISTNIMQIENEYYSVARPKQISGEGETTLAGLARRGIAYVELRALDINCFDWAGISQRQLDFLELFMLFCLFRPAPELDAAMDGVCTVNGARVAARGRDPQLRLDNFGRHQRIAEWGKQILEAMIPIAEAMDREKHRPHYLSIVERMLELIRDPELTPSARILRYLRGEEGGAPMTYHRFITDLSRKHMEKSRRVGITPAERAKVTADAKASWQKAKMLDEASRGVDFEQYLKEYFATIRAV
ncbi:MAG: glutamate--cysteine ligase [Desulfopila sp.]